MAAMPNSTGSSSTNGAPISSTEATAVDGRPVISSQPLQLRLLIDARIPSPPQIFRPKKQGKSRVSRILWPATKSTSNIDTTEEHVAVERPSSLLEVINPDNTNARQGLAPGSPNSSSSPSNPESFTLTTMPSVESNGLSDPSAFKTPTKSITLHVSAPPRLIRGKKRFRSDAGEMSPTARHRLEKRRVRPMI